MNLSPIDQVNNIQKADRQQSPDALRQAATQFEAVLLMQLTSALNSTSNDDDGEEKLFGGDGGTGLAKQMFSEQLATTMAQAGGVGLSDLILSKFGGGPAKKGPAGIKNLAGTFNTIKSAKGNAPVETPVQSRSQKELSSIIIGSADPAAVSKQGFAGNPEDAEIISTFEDQVRAEGIDDSLKNLILDGRIVNTTRPRLAPNAAITELGGTSAGRVADRPAAAAENVSYKYPVQGRVSSGFGNRFHPIDRKIKFHAGLDLAVPQGTRVGAAADGTVKFAGWDGDYGNLVILQHADGRESRYGHLSKLVVKQDDVVSAGQTIALSGSTGKSTGPHVHFEIRENGKVVDPVKVLSKGLSIIAER